MTRNEPIKGLMSLSGAFRHRIWEYGRIKKGRSLLTAARPFLEMLLYSLLALQAGCLRTLSWLEKVNRNFLAFIDAMQLSLTQVCSTPCLRCLTDIASGHPTVPSTTSNINGDRPFIISLHLSLQRFPGLFGLSKAFLISTFGLNSSSMLRSSISPGSDASSFFSMLSPASFSTTPRRPLRELAYSILSLTLLPLGQV